MAKSTPKKSTAKPADGTLQISDSTNGTKEQKLARAVLRPSVTGAVTIEQFSKQFGAMDLSALVDSLADHAKAVSDGDLKQAEGMLIIQAHTLDAIFNNLSRRSALNMGEYMSAAETYMKLALRAQNQCRATLQTLGELKNPQSVAFVKQANITSGPQQVNNGTMPTTPAHAVNNQNQPNELLDAKPYEQLDTRTPSTTSRIDSAMATVGAIDGATDDGR